MDMKSEASGDAQSSDLAVIETRRNDLLDMVRRSALSPTDAEKIAEEENLGPFTSVPPTEEFPVDEEAFWTLEEAVAWVIWQRSDAVRRFHNPFRQKTIVWREVFGSLGPSGYELAPRGDATLDEVRVFAASGIDNPICPFDGALNRVLRHLKSGRVIAAAVRVADSQSVQIEAHEWQHLEILDTSSGSVSLGIPPSTTANYKRVAVPRSKLRELEAIAEVEDLPDFRDERAILIEMVEDGRLLLHDAEQIAQQKGLPPLAVVPDDSEYRVMEMSEWTIEMVLAWIVWQDEQRVRYFYQPYHRILTAPRSPFGVTPEATLGGIQHLLDMEAALQPGIDALTEVVSYEDALRSLVEALQSGDVTAEATELRTMKLVDVPAREWGRLTPVMNETGANILMNGFNVAVYGDVRFDRAQIVHHGWSRGESKSGGREGASVAVGAGVLATNSPSNIAERIRAAGGVPKLTPTEKQIWEAIQTSGGEGALPTRPQDYIRTIQNNTKGSTPSRSSIDRFFARFRNSNAQA